MKRTYRAGGSCGKSSGLQQQRGRLDERRERAAAKRPLEEVIDLGPVQLPLGPEALQAVLSEEIHSFAIDLGLLVAREFLESEVTRLCGKRYQRQPGREHTRYGHQAGFVTLAGQKASLQRPRVRQAGGGPEVELPLYQQMQSPEALPEAALKRMVRGVSTRNYEEVVDLARHSFGVQKSSVSRAFVKATAAAVKELSSRRLDQERFLALFVDGVEYAGETMLVALGITEQGEKKILGLRQGASENAEVCTSLLEELCQRGLDTTQPILAVLDGSKALAAAVKRVWGTKVRIQRCQIHKRRNIEAHLPQQHHAELRRLLNAAWHDTDYERARKQLLATVKWLDRINPDAANSLCEGMDETLTVVKLGLPELLRQTLATTNPIESALSITRTVTGRVTHWRDGDMRLRWCTAGLLRAEEKFRRIKGFRHLADLARALEREINPPSLESNRKSA
ncbi:MAG: IS256 family transposase [Candidatus Acidiferrales bacterium]